MVTQWYLIRRFPPWDRTGAGKVTFTLVKILRLSFYEEKKPVEPIQRLKFSLIIEARNTKSNVQPAHEMQSINRKRESM